MVNICLPPVKKTCLDSNPVIWRFFYFGPSQHQITIFKVLSSLVIWENFGLSPCHIINISVYPPSISSILYCQSSWRSKTKNIQITGLESKQFFLQGVNRKSLILQGLLIYIYLPFLIILWGFYLSIVTRNCFWVTFFISL